MIIDVFKDREFFNKLEVYNDDIRSVCSKHSFAEEGEEYDLANDKSSCWFNPDFIRELHISEFYPRKSALTYKIKFNLILHVYNYISLYVINTLYEDKDILIEDLAGGMGRLLFYLSKLGFTSFHNIDNFTQLSKSLFDDLMTEGNIKCKLNDLELSPVVMCTSSLPFLIRGSMPDSVELFCCYYHNGILQKRGKDYYVKSQGDTTEDGFISLSGYRLLCVDRDNLTYCFCRKNKYNEFVNKIQFMECKLMSKNTIPQYEPLIGEEERKEVNEYMAAGGWITEFKKTQEFENKIKSFLGFTYCFTVNNGTISLSLALLAAGIGPGDKVAVPNLTMIGTFNAVKLIGAEPVLIDVEKDTLCMDPQGLYNYKQLGIKAVIYVSLNGRWNENGDLIKLFEMLKKDNIPIIEDAAQSFGSSSYRCKVGLDADITSFSFSMPKIITTGQGGCLVTNDEDLAMRIKVLKDFGRQSGGNDIHPYFGINSKFTDLQAAVGVAQFKEIDYRVKRKKEIYTIYYEQLKDCVHFIPTNLSYTLPWFVDIYLIGIGQRNDVMEGLKEAGIDSRPVYPPVHSQECNKDYNDLYMPVSTSLSERGLWLPCSFTLENKDIDRVCKEIKTIAKV